MSHKGSLRTRHENIPELVIPDHVIWQLVMLRACSLVWVCCQYTFEE
jgi:hypothetical protein